MATKKKSEFVRIHNRSNQRVSVQVKPPAGDFYMHEQQVHLAKGKNVLLPKDHLRMEQITNLSARGVLRVVYDSESNKG